MIFELNYDNQAKELLEGQRRYREQMATEYAAGVIDAKKELQPIIDDLEEKSAKLESKNANLENENARLQALLKEHGISDK